MYYTISHLTSRSVVCGCNWVSMEARICSVTMVCLSFVSLSICSVDSTRQIHGKINAVWFESKFEPNQREAINSNYDLLTAWIGRWRREFESISENFCILQSSNRQICWNLYQLPNLSSPLFLRRIVWVSLWISNSRTDCLWWETRFMLKLWLYGELI